MNMYFFAINLEIFTPDTFYTDVVCGICDKYQVWSPKEDVYTYFKI